MFTAEDKHTITALVSKARFLNKIKEIEYLGKTLACFINVGEGSYILYIPESTTRINCLLDSGYPYAWSEYEQTLRKCTKQLKVYGGEGLRSTELCFSFITADVIDLSHLCTDNVLDMSYTFHNSVVPEIILGDFKTDNVFTMKAMFKNCATNKLDMSNWNLQNVKDMEDMFRGSHISDLNMSCIHLDRFVKTQCMFSGFSGQFTVTDKLLKKLYINR